LADTSNHVRLSAYYLAAISRVARKNSCFENVPQLEVQGGEPVRLLAFQGAEYLINNLASFSKSSPLEQRNRSSSLSVIAMSLVSAMLKLSRAPRLVTLWCRRADKSSISAIGICGFTGGDR
jgi:hypothetical protein